MTTRDRAATFAPAIRQRGVEGRMQIIGDLADLPASAALAVIINCGTKWVSSLALASALRHARYPTLVIDCESHDGSGEHFRALAAAQGWHFYWLDWPLRRHGEALDALFTSANAESILLVDSDAEILDPKPVREMAEVLAADGAAYGAGFLQKAQWLGVEHGIPAGVGWYEERMWIPLVQLRTRPVRDALAAGASFVSERRFVEIPEHPLLSRVLGLRFWLPGLRTLRPFASDTATTRAAGSSPGFVESDTGATMHRRLLSSGYRFRSVAEESWSLVEHQHGVTRTRLESRLRKALRLVRVRRTGNATPAERATAAARSRLATRYGIASQ